MKIEKSASTVEVRPENVRKQDDVNKDELILAHLKKSEELNEEILKAVKFIRRFYFWRGIINGVKIAILVLVIILGIVTWDTITDYVSNYLNDFQENIF